MHYNIVRKAPVIQRPDSFESVRTEWRHIFFLPVILIHVQSFHLLPSIKMLGEFFLDAAQFNLYCSLDNKKQVFHFRFALGS